MPQLGEIRTAGEVGYKSKNAKVIWAACEICGKERWVSYRKSSNGPITAKCLKCAKRTHAINYRGENHHAWKGGRYIDKDGYIRIAYPNHPFCAANGSICEHRLIMEGVLGRYLTDSEVVHHIDGDKQNNDPKNLMLLNSRSEHMRLHRQEQKESLMI
jgi:hypothetical protein